MISVLLAMLWLDVEVCWLIVIGLMFVILLFSAQGQADYSAAWAAYYQQFYQQQAAAAAGQAAPGMLTKIILLAWCKGIQAYTYSEITQS